MTKGKANSKVIMKLSLLEDYDEILYIFIIIISPTQVLGSGFTVDQLE